MIKEAVKLDEKDRKILVELDRDARQTDSEIAKKVGLSKQVTNYRIQKLIEKGVITNFYTLINIGKLGLGFYYVFLQFERTNLSKSKELLKKIENLEFVGWLVDGVGRWDAVVGINAKSNSEFDEFLNKLVSTCGVHLHEYIFTTLITAEHLNYKMLSEKKVSVGMKQSEVKEKSKLDEEDKKILRILSQNARLSSVELSEKTKLPLHIVRYHLKRMIKEKFIEGFKPKINISRLGYEWHLLLLRLDKISSEKKNELLNFCRNHSKIYYVTNTIGFYNLMLDIHVRNINEFREVLFEIRDKFAETIKTCESMIVFDELKIDYAPSKLLKSS